MDHTDLLSLGRNAISRFRLYIIVLIFFLLYHFYFSSNNLVFGATIYGVNLTPVSTTIEDNYIFNNPKIRFIVRSQGDVTALITSQIVNGNISCSPSPNNPSAVAPNTIAEFLFICSSMNCQDYSSVFNAQPVIYYNDSIQTKSVTSQQVVFSITDPLVITSRTPTQESIAIDLGKYALITFSFKNLGSNTLNTNLSFNYLQSLLYAQFMTSQGTYSKEGIEGLSFQLGKNEEETIRILVVPITSGTGSFTINVGESTACINCGESINYNVFVYSLSKQIIEFKVLPDLDFPSFLILLLASILALHKVLNNRKNEI
ncbi:MAG: hypothetical protein OH319_00190 [Candidatus Parvarchaeota archaeon]|nr:hypothetical protein [Candidatus Jingweiarchaeum tengchongense]MCW1298438.1 hypothetical protein [Candidatus Jingweiarchaeum tengchongense]MCW1300530.1 hypothetical protein [Candidatus Jingweiarchaeum tengchongense]MCW1304995.1 hypothetical protein [Candidatus Jingweiarchaeum tengchongense]MCW1306015.1 hypothetical protein [Candidatus Jingweiarchaeum tengchongense]